jgi:predicted dehydrogenase
VIENPLTVPIGDYFNSDTASHTDPNWFLGTHYYDLIRFMTGLDPLEVRAAAYHGALRKRGLPSPDSFKLDVRMSNGASISFFLAWNLPERSPSLTKQAMTLHFERGELELDGLRRGFQVFGEQGYAYANPYFLRSTASGWVGYGALFLEEALLSLQNAEYISSVTLPSVEDAWWASALAHAAQRSVDEGGPQSVIPPPR